MFSKPILSLGALALAAVTTAKPIPAFKDVLAKRGGHSFNGYGGYDSMAHFDDFYGADDYSGVSQHYVPEKRVVCHSEKVEIVQQHLAVIREWYKKIITEQVCEVEVQTIVHNQFLSGCEGFCDDLRRKSHRHIGYDHEIASHIVNIHDNDGNCGWGGLDFHGVDIGSHGVDYYGDNWVEGYSPEIVSTAWDHAKQSYGYSSAEYAPSWSSGYEAPSWNYGASYTYEAPSYGGYNTYEAPSYNTYEAPSYNTYEAPSYNTYEAPSEYHTYDPPSEYHTEAPSYGYNTYQAPPPSYTPVYGGYQAPSYGSPSYGQPGYSGPGPVSGPAPSGNSTDVPPPSVDSAAPPSDTSTPDASAAAAPTPDASAAASSAAAPAPAPSASSA